MSRTLTITLEVSDTELANLLDRFKERGAVEVGDTFPEGPKPTGAFDERGVVWDARFHASTKTTNQDGSWKARRGMSDEEKADAAAYESAFTDPAPTTAPVALVADDTTIPAFLQKDASAVAAAAVPVAPTVPAMPAMPVVAPTPEPVTYDQLLAEFKAIQADPARADRLMPNLAAMYAAAGVTDPNTLQTNETQRAALMVELKKL